MNLIELDRALRQLRLSGMAAVLDTRLRQAQSEKMTPIDLVSALVADELRRRQDRLLERRHKLARFRDPDRSLDTFDFDFNKKMNRALIYELATARFITVREDVLFLGPPGTGKSHLAQAIGRTAIQQGYRVIYREAHTLLEELAEATLAGTRKDYLLELAMVPLLIIDDLGMRKLAHTAAEDLLELIMRRYERASTMLTSNRPVDDWGKLLGDTAAGHRAARSPPASRPRPQMRSPQLAHQGPQRLAYRGGHEVKLTRLGRQKNVGFARPLNVGFELSTEAGDESHHTHSGGGGRPPRGTSTSA
jgi:DNA replication protein DnaC